MNIGGKSGKSELAYALAILTREEKKFIDSFSEVRNRFAHGVKRFKTTFDEFFSSVSDTKKFERSLPILRISNSDGTQTSTFATDKRTLIFCNFVSICVNISRRWRTTLTVGTVIRASVLMFCKLETSPEIALPSFADFPFPVVRFSEPPQRAKCWQFWA